MTVSPKIATENDQGKYENDIDQEKTISRMSIKSSNRRLNGTGSMLRPAPPGSA